MNHIHLDSRNSLTLATPHDSSWHVTLGNPENKPGQIHLREATLVNLAGPFPSYSNKFYVDGNGTTYTVTLDDGAYSGDDLANALEDGLNALASTSTWTVDFDQVTYKITITLVADGGEAPWTIVSGDDSAYDQLGITSTLPIAITTTVTSDTVVRLDGAEYIDVLCDAQSTLGNYVDMPRYNILARIPLVAEYGAIIHYEPPIEALMPITQPITSLKITIRLVKPDGQLMTLPQTCPVRYHLVATH